MTGYGKGDVRYFTVEKYDLFSPRTHKMVDFEFTRNYYYYYVPTIATICFLFAHIVAIFEEISLRYYEGCKLLRAIIIIIGLFEARFANGKPHCPLSHDYYIVAN